ncbi:MAG: FGGY-family carbohydrate kinase, partial [bacterium]
VVLGCFDHPAAARATGTLAPGNLMFSCGTSWVGFYPVADRATALAMGMLVDPFLQPAGPWAAMFSLPRIGQTIDVLVERAAGPTPAGGDPQARFRRFDALAESAPRGAGGLCLDLMRGEAAQQVPAGVVPGLLSRAVMEAAAFHMLAKVETLTAAGWRPRHLTMVGGPSRSAVWSRVLADVIGLPFQLGVRQNAGAIGAAVLAGLGTGVFTTVQAAATAVAGEPEVIQPEAVVHDQYTPLFANWKAKISCP